MRNVQKESKILLGRLCTLRRGHDLPMQKRHHGTIPIYSSGGISGYHNEKKCSAPGIITGRYGTIGDVFFSNSDYWPLNTTLYVEDFHGNNPKFIYYLLQSIDWKKYSEKSAVPGVNRNDVHNEEVYDIPTEIQIAISAYLDTKCSQIDSTIANIRALIDNLKEYKQSVITQAVTKGLDPDVPTKDSGVPWIGEIPEKWSICKFGHIAKVKSNLVEPAQYQDYMQISPDSIEKDTSRILFNKTVSESGVISSNHLFHNGQIIYSKIRPILNKVTIAPYDGLCSADMYPIETVINSKYLLYSMLSLLFLYQVSLVTECRVKMPKINVNELSNLLIVLPDDEIQNQIADYLDTKCAKIYSQIAEQESLLTKLEAYKKSLIYECVTGKREVPPSFANAS